jgi:hypothetical protein
MVSIRYVSIRVQVLLNKFSISWQNIMTLYMDIMLLELTCSFSFYTVNSMNMAVVRTSEVEIILVPPHAGSKNTVLVATNSVAPKPKSSSPYSQEPATGPSGSPVTHHGTASPQVSDGGDGLQIWRVARINWRSSGGQPTRGGHTAWGLGREVTTPTVRKYLLRNI